MAMIRWEPAAELNTIQNEMNRLFNTFFDQPAQTERGNGPTRRWLPAMDIVETGDRYLLRADLPGLKEGDVNIQFEDKVLTISGERKSDYASQPQGYYRLECGYGSFTRSLTLPDGVDPDGISASFDAGVLEISIPKPEQKKPRSVQINVAPSAKTEIIESSETQNYDQEPVEALA
jgi:HSP20 family protein